MNPHDRHRTKEGSQESPQSIKNDIHETKDLTFRLKKQNYVILNANRTMILGWNGKHVKQQQYIDVFHSGYDTVEADAVVLRLHVHCEGGW